LIESFWDFIVEKDSMEKGKGKGNEFVRLKEVEESN